EVADLSAEAVTVTPPIARLARGLLSAPAAGARQTGANPGLRRGRRTRKNPAPPAPPHSKPGPRGEKVRPKARDAGAAHTASRRVGEEDHRADAAGEVLHEVGEAKHPGVVANHSQRGESEIRNGLQDAANP